MINAIVGGFAFAAAVMLMGVISDLYYGWKLKNGYTLIA